MAGRLPYRWVARLLAVLLFLAAGLKIYGLRVEPIAAGGIFSAVEIQVALVEFEIVLGIWLWSGVRPILSWLVALVTFSGFATVSAHLAWIGQSSCGCFGAVRVNPLLALSLDGAILLALFLGRPDLTALRNNPRQVILNGAPAILAAVAGMIAIFIALLGAAHVAFGSLPEAMAYFREERLSIEPRLVTVGEAHSGEARQLTVEIANRTSKAVRIIGARRDCSCRVDDLPLQIPPGASRSLSLTVNVAGQEGIFTRSAVLLVDDDGLKELSLRFTGRILPKNDEAAAEGG